MTRTDDALFDHGLAPVPAASAERDGVERWRERLSRADAAFRGLDFDESFPLAGVAALSASGLLASPFPEALGGDGLAIGRPRALAAVLGAVARTDLSLGRLYEGHVNAVALAMRYGSRENLASLQAEAGAGRLGGVWMAGEPLVLERREDGALVLEGRKRLCSGSGFVRRPLVAADFEGGSIMLLPELADPGRIDRSAWTVRGMGGSASGTVDFTGLVVDVAERLGAPGDYLRSPYFRGGAWRVLATQLGGVEAVLDLYRAHLRAGPYRDHPVQLARFGEALMAARTARLWVEHAGAVAEGPFDDAEAVDATVDLARNAFEAAATTVVACAEKAIGLGAFTRPNPIERVIRDLQTYLRQPALDVSLQSAAAFHLGVPA